MTNNELSKNKMSLNLIYWEGWYIHVKLISWKEKIENNVLQTICRFTIGLAAMLALVAVHTSLVMVSLDNWTPSFCTTTINIRYDVTYSCKCQIWTHRVAFTKSFVKDVLYVWSFFFFRSTHLTDTTTQLTLDEPQLVTARLVLLNDSQMFQ